MLDNDNSKRKCNMIGLCPVCGKVHYGVLKDHKLIITPGDEYEGYDPSSKEQQIINMEDLIINDGGSSLQFVANCMKCNEFGSEIQWFDPELYNRTMVLMLHKLIVTLAGFGTGGTGGTIDDIGIFFRNGILNITAYSREATRTILDAISSTINPLIRIKGSPKITIEPNIVNYKFDIDFGDLDDDYIMNWLKRFVDSLHKNLLEYKGEKK